MAKQRADNGIDYTPRRESARQRVQEAHRLASMTRHVHGVVQRKHIYPIFEVSAGGKCVEWTELRSDAHKAFADADVLPKTLCVVHSDGRRVLLDVVTQTGRRLAQPETAREAA